ncbi:biotin--[acetyl-CoA-carboxylase] ligase [Persephonella sp.]
MDKIDQIILEQIEDKTVSGEKLSKLTGISRVAVWKRIKKLEDLGYRIKHSSEGYRLIERTPYLLPVEIKRTLKTGYIGKNYIFFDQIDSTNIFAKSNDLPDGTVVLAENQTKGKGRKGRRWISSKGKGLYFSIVIKRNYPLNDLMKLSLLFPYAVKEAIKGYIENQIKIKWPNDLYINNRKFAGFLIETEIEGNEINRIIAGIGININNEPEEFGDIKDTATSLKIEEGKTFCRKEIFCKVLETIEKSLNNFNSLDLINEIEKDLLWKGENIHVLDEGIEGRLIGLDSSGGLKVLTEKGVLTIYSGDISVRKV